MMLELISLPPFPSRAPAGARLFLSPGSQAAPTDCHSVIPLPLVGGSSTRSSAVPLCRLATLTHRGRPLEDESFAEARSGTRSASLTRWAPHFASCSAGHSLGPTQPRQKFFRRITARATCSSDVRRSPLPACFHKQRLIPPAAALQVLPEDFPHQLAAAASVARHPLLAGAQALALAGAI